MCEIKGIGEWTAECYMLASLGRKDIWPVKDLGLQAALKELKNLDLRPNEIEMSEMANSWKPYRSIVANVLWASHDWFKNKDFISRLWKWKIKKNIQN